MSGLVKNCFKSDRSIKRLKQKARQVLESNTGEDTGDKQMNNSSEQPPTSSESAVPTEKANKKHGNAGLLYGLLALGVVVIVVGVVLIFVL